MTTTNNAIANTENIIQAEKKRKRKKIDKALQEFFTFNSAEEVNKTLRDLFSIALGSEEFDCFDKNQRAELLFTIEGVNRLVKKLEKAKS